jgi:hypothetical protein
LVGVVAFAYVRHFKKLFDGPAEVLPFATARPAEPVAETLGKAECKLRESVRADSEIMVESKVVEYLVISVCWKYSCTYRATTIIG